MLSLGGTDQLQNWLPRRLRLAFHGSRLNEAHISASVDAIIDLVCVKQNIARDELAKQILFMSHETYTPARGGSATAEIKALRYAFGPEAKHIAISNTKGFTGHSMGAGIEDVIAPTCTCCKAHSTSSQSDTA